jgi:hypothetical protein
MRLDGIRRPRHTEAHARPIRRDPPSCTCCAPLKIWTGSLVRWVQETY